MVRACGLARDGGPDPHRTPADQLHTAVAAVARRIIDRRFGVLPETWHVA